jgi:hypothetical protein
LQQLCWNLCRYVHACVHRHWCAKLQNCIDACICVPMLKIEQVEPNNISQLINLDWGDHVHIYLIIFGGSSSSKQYFYWAIYTGHLLLLLIQLISSCFDHRKSIANTGRYAWEYATVQP